VTWSTAILSARKTLCVIAPLVFCLPGAALAQAPDQPTPQPDIAVTQARIRAAYQAAQAARLVGPREIELSDQGRLDLPAGFAFIPAAEAGRLLRSSGNSVGKGLQGLVFPEGKPGQHWWAELTFQPAGYIKDDDARDWNVPALLQGLTDGTNADNARRATLGLPELVVEGWVEPPRYDAMTHRLVWSLAVRDKNASDTDPRDVNYNTYALGRDGFFSLDLITDLDAIEAEKPIAQRLLGSLIFNDGKGYADFDSTTDRVAEFGLAALIAGVAAKKLGLLALIGLWLAKSAKLVALVAGGLAMLGARFFKRRSVKYRPGTPVPAQSTEAEIAPRDQESPPEWRR
jgi:uncharacterized membrane-anchored protein